MGVSQCELPSLRRCPLAPRPPPLRELGGVPQLPVRYDIPEHRTFVEFGSDEQMGHPSGASTAPAAMACCIRDSLDDGQAFVVTPSSAGLPAEWSAEAWGHVLGLPQAGQEANGASSEEEGGDASDDDEEADSVVCPAYSEHAALPSKGSAGHGAGACRRCCFFPKGRCNNGAGCNFCHFAHEKRKTSSAKKKKHKRKKARRAAKGAGCGAGGTAQVFLHDTVMSYVMVVPVPLPFGAPPDAGAS